MMTKTLLGFCMKVSSSINNLCCGVLVVLFSTSIGFAKDLGSVGRVYPIKERDALKELEARAAGVNWNKELTKIKPDRYRPENGVSLPRANKNKSFLVDMTYTVEMDIPDGKGGILYPKGYSFNPLDFVPFRKRLVVLNGSDKEQLAWFRQSSFAGRPDVMLLITDGSYLKLGEALSRPVFYADTRIIEKFRLKSVPSVVQQEGRMMKVEEIDVRPDKKH